MLRRFKFLSMLFILCAGSLFAHPCQGGWEIDAEFLYLFPTVDDTYFVIDSTTSTAFPSGTRRNNDFGFNSGFRVGGAYGLCDCNAEFQIYYTRLRSTESRTVSGSFLWATIGRADFASLFENYAGSASSSLDLLYQRVDGLFAQHAWCVCNTNIYLQAGAEFDSIRLKENYEYRTAAGAVGLISQKGKTWGVGPQIGMEFDYNICQLSGCYPGRLSFVGKTSSSLLVSQCRMEADNLLTTGPTLAVNDEKTWRIIPALHARFGFNYVTCFSCSAASFEVGYEFNTYLRALTRYGFPDDVADGQCFTNYYDFDVQGLYIAATFSF